MEIRRLGGAIFRSQLSPLASLILPSITGLSSTAWYTAPPVASRQYRPALTPSLSRSISTNEPPHQQQSASAPDSPPKPGTSPAKSNFDDDLVSLLNLPPKPDRRKLGTGPTASERKVESSASDIMAHYQEYSSPGRIATDRMLTPSSAAADSPSPNISSSDFLLHTPASAASSPPMPKMRLNSSTGRSVAINKHQGIDLARALRNLDLLCRQNNVRLDFMRQRFHERPGLKRKRLKSMRWRKNFMKGFKGMVAKVDEMRKKGW